MNKSAIYKFLVMLVGVQLFCIISNATNYTVSSLSSLQSKMNAALPGDTVIVVNGTYKWGAINITNSHGTSTSAWIVLKAQSFNGVVFSGNTYIQFSGKHILINGFRFSNGNVGTNDVISFRNSSNTAASYCRITNITIDNYNSDSTGSYANTGTKNGGDTLNRWVSIYGTNNRVDHCTFINKYNGDPTVVIWYDSSHYPARATPTFHRIDSNYFKYRGYWGGNEGEVIRVGTSTNSRTDAHNIIEYNLFEEGAQVDPEIISNKSNFNTYRYNTFHNHSGGITLREGRFCSVYGNFFIRDAYSHNTDQYGVRVIDKGHKVFNNYIEGLNGNVNSLNSLRCPIILYNGVTTEIDTINPTYAALYFPADSCIVAFNTIVNCSGGAGLVIGFNNGGANTFQPTGIIVANNLIKMSKGQALMVDTAGSNLTTYFSEGNMYQAPKFGMANTTGFNSKILTFGTRSNGILPPPSLVQDAAINTGNYVSLLNGLDVEGENRSAIYDVGADELNGTGTIIASPLDSTLVGAGTPLVHLPVVLLSFTAKETNNATLFQWAVTQEINLQQYEVEYSSDAVTFTTIGIIIADNHLGYLYKYYTILNGFFRLKLVDVDGNINYSPVISLISNSNTRLKIYPNPVKDNLIINFENIIEKSFINIISQSGETIKSVQVNSGVNNISLSKLTNGMYIIQLINNNKMISSTPFIIAK